MIDGRMKTFSTILSEFTQGFVTEPAENWRKGLTFQMFLKNRVDFKNKINFNNSNWIVIYIVGITKYKVTSRGKICKLLFQEWI